MFVRNQWPRRAAVRHEVAWKQNAIKGNSLMLHPLKHDERQSKSPSDLVFSTIFNLNSC